MANIIYSLVVTQFIIENTILHKLTRRSVLNPLKIILL